MVALALPHPLSDDLADLIAHRFRLLAEPMRMRLIDRLRDGEAGVQELTDGLETSQQNVSKHLALLTQAGIVARRKEGNHAYYRIADESVLALCEQVCGSLEHELRGLSGLVSELAGTNPERSTR